jgi:hypothetical protein
MPSRSRAAGYSADVTVVTEASDRSGLVAPARGITNDAAAIDEARGKEVICRRQLIGDADTAGLGEPRAWIESC